MNPTLKLYGSIALVVAALSGYIVWRNEERAIGARDVRISGLATENMGLKSIIGLDSAALAKKDTVRLFAKIDTGHTIIQRLIDTAHVYHTDTVKITVEKLVTIDSTIKACRETVVACAQLATDQGKRIVVLDSLVLALNQSQPSFLSRHASVTVGYGAVEQGGKVIAGPGVLAGWRVWP